MVHEFKYQLFMCYLDLHELENSNDLSNLLPRKNFGFSTFREKDHLKDFDYSLTESVKELFRLKTDYQPTGPIRLLTQLSYFGYYFSPLNLYYCFDSKDKYVEAIIAEVTNTPWKEEYLYILDSDNQKISEGDNKELFYSHPKDFHVSPFMEMQQQYNWKVTEPTDNLTVDLTSFQDSKKKFQASLILQKKELTRTNLLKMRIRFPFMSAQIMQGIYWQAFKLWWKKCPFYSHPKQQTQLQEATIEH